MSASATGGWWKYSACSTATASCISSATSSDFPALVAGEDGGLQHQHGHLCQHRYLTDHGYVTLTDVPREDVRFPKTPSAIRTASGASRRFSMPSDAFAEPHPALTQALETAAKGGWYVN